MPPPIYDPRNPYTTFPDPSPPPLRPATMPNGVKSWLQDRVSKPMVTGDRSLTGPNATSASQFSPMGDKIGSRGMTPERRMEMLNRRAYTQGDQRTLMQTTGALLNIAQNQQGMNFHREQDANKFQQNVQLWQANAEEASAHADSRRRHEMNMAADAMAARELEIKNRQEWDLRMYGMAKGDKAMEDERRRRQEEEDRNRVPNITVTPTPGSPYNTVISDGKVINVLPQTQAPSEPGFTALPGTDIRIPTQGGERIPGLPLFQETPRDLPPVDGVGPQRPGIMTPLDGGNSGVPKIQQFEINGRKVPHEYNPKTGRWRPVQFEDANGNGIDDKEEAGGNAGAAATPGAAWRGLGGR